MGDSSTNPPTYLSHATRTAAAGNTPTTCPLRHSMGHLLPWWCAVLAHHGPLVQLRTPVAATFWVNASRVLPLLTFTKDNDPSIFLGFLKKDRNKIKKKTQRKKQTEKKKRNRTKREKNDFKRRKWKKGEKREKSFKKFKNEKVLKNEFGKTAQNL